MQTPDITQLPEGVRQGDERLVKLTLEAWAQAMKLSERESASAQFLRLGISGGGCNGLSYKLKFVESARKGDILVFSSGVPLLIDSKSALYLKGSELDYSSALVGGGFKFHNPNATSSCSCGESFSV